MFFPPAVMMSSFLRPVIVRNPSSSRVPMSLVWKVSRAEATTATTYVAQPDAGVVVVTITRYILVPTQYDAVLAHHGCAGRVRFAGVLCHADVLEHMAEADLLIAPSVIAKDGDRESGLVVVKEAAARSVPTIGTRHGGIPEIIDDERTGFLVAAVGEHLAGCVEYGRTVFHD